MKSEIFTQIYAESLILINFNLKRISECENLFKQLKDRNWKVSILYNFVCLVSHLMTNVNSSGGRYSFLRFQWNFLYPLFCIHLKCENDDVANE